MTRLMVDPLARVCKYLSSSQLSSALAVWRGGLLAGQQLQCRQLSTSLQQPEQLPHYKIEVSLKAFEPRYLEAASQAVRDLLFINLAPQGGVPSSNASPSPSPVSLALPIKHIPIRLNWKRSRFTVIRGPHIDKRGREQFEMRKYKVVVQGATCSAQDVHWFLDSMRLYEFPGVQIQVAMNSNTYLPPLPALPALGGAVSGSKGEGASGSSMDDAHNPSLLAEHRSLIARYLMPGKIAAQQQQQQRQQSAGAPSSSTSPGNSMEAALRSLREVVYLGLRQQRQELSGNMSYQHWHMENKLKTPHLASLPPAELDPAASSTSHNSADMLLGQRLQELSAAATGGATPFDRSTDLSSGSLSSSHSSSSVSKSGGPRVGGGKSRAAAFLAVADAVFLNLHFEALESHRHFPMHFATYQIGHEVPAAQWMGTVLRAGQFACDMEAKAQERELMSLYTQYSLFAHSLLYTLYKMWLSCSKEEAARYLALPPEPEAVERLIKGDAATTRSGGI